MNPRERPNLHLVPKPIARVPLVACPPERRPEMRRALGMRLEKIARECTELASGADELGLDAAALELELIAQCVRAARARIETKPIAARSSTPLGGGDDVG